MDGTLAPIGLDVNDRTEAACDRTRTVWDETAHALQRCSSVIYRHERAASYGEASVGDPEKMERYRQRLLVLRDALSNLAFDMERGL